MPAMNPARYSFCSTVNSPEVFGFISSVARVISGVLLQPHGAELQFGLARNRIRLSGGQRVDTAVLAKRLAPVKRHKERPGDDRIIGLERCAREAAPRHEPHSLAILKA